MAVIARNWFGIELTEPLPAPVGVIVGEQPGPRSNPRLPMWPYPASSAGGRLHAMSGLDVDTYLTRLARVNLQATTGRWHKANAMAAAVALYREYRVPNGAPREEWPRFVLCGARVAASFGFDPVEWFATSHRQGVAYVVVPHPSGRNHLYNDEDVRVAAGAAVRWAAGIEPT